ncbi:MAG: ABC transporter permease [Candidatus Atribacteria bacterium]|nr:ABC transporter permease [Candidatus Atribacteria bacterium]
MSNKILRQYGTLIALFVVVVIFSVLKPGAFPTFANLVNITRQISLLTIISVGATIAMVVAEFDLSIGAVASFGGVLAAGFTVQGVNIVLSMLIPVGLSFLFGLGNGYLITRFRIFSFIATLSTGTILGGITFWYTGGATIFGGIPDSFLWIGQAKISFIPVPTMLMIVVVFFFWFIFSWTEFGRRLYAIGGNPVASRLSGVHVNRDKTYAFGLSSLLSAFTGVILASRLGSAHPTAGSGMLLQAYAAVFLGMTAFKAGIPNIWGTFIGSLLIGIVANGLTMLQVPYFLQDIVTGMIVILAVILQHIDEWRG